MSEATAELALSSAEQQKGDYPAALKHAQKAIALKPDMVSAHFAAAVIADGMCIPNAQPGPNMRECNLAIQEYKRVLEIDASHQEASKDLAYLLWQFGREESEAFYRKALALNPNDPEALAAVAAIDANRSWKEIALRKAALPVEKSLIGFSWCSEIREKNVARVNEGISLLTKALGIKNDNIEFMGWLSQLYKTRAEIQCGNPPAYRADTSEARKWDRLRSATRTIGGDHSLRRYPPAPPPGPPEK
jgi:tetratricopeptide (TPR) repeat protein